MRGRIKRREKVCDSGRMRRNLDGTSQDEGDASCGGCRAGESVAPVAGETLSTPDTHRSSGHGDASPQNAEAGPEQPGLDTEKRYLGVRVKMPVKDMLRSLRLAKGLDPAQAQGANGKACKGEKKRVTTHGDRRGGKRKRPTKSLEELAIIVEVLEEDLKTRLSQTPPPPPPPPLHPPPQPVSLHALPPPPISPVYRPSLQPLSPAYPCDPRGRSPRSPGPPLTHYCPPPAPLCGPPAPPLSSLGEGSGDESDDIMMSSPGSLASCSPGLSEYQAPPSPPAEGGLAGPRAPGRLWGEGRAWPGYQDQAESWDGPAFFWTQLQREEDRLREVTDADLLTTDQNGKTPLHRAVMEGRRPLGYVIARRMAALKRLDVRDLEGKTALHLAAQRNQHLMVADLVRLGASINARDWTGKTCLHLSAENGYIRVLEVLKNMMNDGVFVDVEATDNCGLSVLQCAAVSLTLTVRELRRSHASPGQTRLHTLRKDQMMETLECLLLMGSYPHTPGSYLT